MFKRVFSAYKFKKLYNNSSYNSFLCRCFLLFVSTLSIQFIGLSNLYAEQLLVNTNTSDEQISRNRARLYFSQRLTHWPDGKSITLVVLPDNDPLHIAFSKKILGLYPYQLRRAWDRQLFTGTGQAPITVKNEQQARELIATTPGSISYVSGDNYNQKIRLLEVR